VLQAASVTHIPINSPVTNFEVMSTLPYVYETTIRQLVLLSTVWRLNESRKNAPPGQTRRGISLLLQHCFSSAGATFHCVFGAVRNRVHVTRSTAHRIAGGGCKCRGDKRRSHQLLDHGILLALSELPTRLGANRSIPAAQF
jgi:hypothetical protein